MKQIKMSYKSLGGFEFSQAMAKLENTPTANFKASHINQIAKRVKAGREKLHDEYKSDIVEKFSKKDDSGKVIENPEVKGGFEMVEGKDEEFEKAFKEFEAREHTIDWRPLTPDTLSDIKLSAREIDLLGPLYSEEPQGPGVPLKSV